MTHEFFQNPFSPGRRYAPWLEVAAFVIGALDAFVNNHIWAPAITYYIVLLLVGADFFTGAMCGHRSPGGFETRRAKKVFFTFLTYTGIMFVAHKMGRNEPALFWLPQAVLLPTVVINLTSVIKNASLLGWLPKKIAYWLYKNIDTYKNHTQTNANAPSNPESNRIQVDGHVPDLHNVPGNDQLQPVPEESPFA